MSVPTATASLALTMEGSEAHRVERNRRPDVTLAITSDVIALRRGAIHVENHNELGGDRMTPLEKLKAMRMPFAELKGVEFVEAEKDRVVARMTVRPDLCTLHHTIHGGAVMALADSVGAAATVINLPEGAKGTTTLESKTNFIGGAKEGTTIVATATPVHRGRRTQVWTTRLETEDGKLVAVVTQTQLILV
ncbi:uncharacterized protein (TIGR00369 family) [Bradyrhizobium sp. LM2.7]